MVSGPVVTCLFYALEPDDTSFEAPLSCTGPCRKPGHALVSTATARTHTDRNTGRDKAATIKGRIRTVTKYVCFSSANTAASAGTKQRQHCYSSAGTKQRPWHSSVNGTQPFAGTKQRHWHSSVNGTQPFAGTKQQHWHSSAS